MITALISAGATLTVAIITLIINAYIERFRSKLEIQQKMLQSKRENLNDVYKILISIISLYPSSSPNDIMKFVEYSPNYSMEHYDAVLRSLDYQAEDYKNQLNVVNLDYERKSDIETQISNREYVKNKISENRDEYYIARDKYKSFCECDKVAFDLYAGQEVRNRLVEFEVVIHNVFISGQNAGEDGDPINNIIHVSRINLINSMRSDLGI
ncbi:hypothetical protein ABFV83_15865 [Lacrimispora sp. BS-2]|uniref:Uncharacterized protein n=1 Tax=Lacrimispora sp. BS-2 TaxID=3151850 RepID=A0AAU7PNC5_9FIRM